MGGGGAEEFKWCPSSLSSWTCGKTTKLLKDLRSPGHATTTNVALGETTVQMNTQEKKYQIYHLSCFSWSNIANTENCQPYCLHL